MGDKGYRNERELRQKLSSRGFAILRTPSSGSSTTDDLPDITAGYYGRAMIAAEAKRSNPTPIYLDRDEIRALAAFSHNFGALPVVTGRWDQDTTQYVCHIHDLYETDGGNYRMHPDEAKDGEYATLDDLLDMMDRYGECGICGSRAPTGKSEEDVLIHTHGCAHMCESCRKELL